jgi:hypothetical protein
MDLLSKHVGNQNRIPAAMEKQLLSVKGLLKAIYIHFHVCPPKPADADFDTETVNQLVYLAQVLV